MAGRIIGWRICGLFQQHDDALDRRTAVKAQGFAGGKARDEAGGGGQPVEIVLTMGIAQTVAQQHIAGLGALDGEGEDAARREPRDERGEDLVERSDVDEDVGGGDEIEDGFGFAQKSDRIGDDEVVVDRLGGGLLDHLRREIDADQPAGAGAEDFAHQAGSAAEIKGSGEGRAILAGRPQGLQMGAEEPGDAVAEGVHERCFEAVGIVVEQAPYICFRRAVRGRRQTEGGELQRGPEEAVGIVGEKGLEDGGGGRPVAEGDQRIGEADPGGEPTRCALEGLFEEVAGGGVIAVGGEAPGIGVSPVGQEIA